MTPTRINNRSSIGILIKELREAKGLTRYKLAKAAGITQGQLNHIEAGSKNSGLELYITVLRALCAELYVSE